MDYLKIALVLLSYILSTFCKTVSIPSFQKLLYHYPGYKHFGGRFSHRRIIDIIGCNKTDLLHDTSALRISFALNKIGSVYSIGYEPIHLSKYGKDSVTGRDRLQYLFHPLAFGPYMADKYGYPSISVLHDKDPIATKRKFWGKQGIMEIITYTKFGNKPKGHIALWNCDRLHQAKDWISKHSLLTIQFWESQDSNCDSVVNRKTSASKVTGTWRTVKLDTLRAKPVKKLSRYNEIIDGAPHRLIKFLH